MISRLQDPKFMRPFSKVAAVLMLNLAIPASLYAHDPYKPVNPKPESEVKEAVTRLLTPEEMEARKGRVVGNPYFAGQAKFDVVHKGVNIRTGNYSMSATDISFEGGYGIPVNVTRSYSANSIDEGPFGYGWTLSADLRSTAGGLLKSSSAPVRSVPIGMKRRPTTEVDPNRATQPVEAVVLTDADGKETTVQRDVDGVLTGPAWDKNEYETEYEYVEFGGSVYWVLVANKTMTPDGTVYQYEKKGYFPNGSKPWNDTGATAEPNNVLKPVWVEDRHGNRTDYVYGTSDLTFAKSNGTVYEKPLVQVEMPNGRTIDFNWSGNRISQVRVWNVNDPEDYEVDYIYSGGQLVSVTTPGGKTTNYGYSQNLLTSITDPRGLVTTITYSAQVMSQGGHFAPSVYAGRQYVSEIVEPSGLRTLFYNPQRVPGASLHYAFEVLPSGASSGSSFSHYPAATFQFNQNTTTGDWTVKEGNFFTHGAPIYNNAEVTKVFLGTSQDLVLEQLRVLVAGAPAGALSLATEKVSTYNFFGNPLSEISKEYVLAYPANSTPTRTITTETAYWGEEKYFQQKAVKVSAAGMDPRYSYTDYYDSSAAVGSKGQTYRVYDNKHAAFQFTGTAPDYAVSGGYAWKYQINPSNPSKYSAQFEYDSKGRPTKVWKLQKVVSGTHEYVLTESTYGADNYPAYGNATMVVEDAGTGKINRTTETLEFDLMGRAVHTRDGGGREFVTEYDKDGLVLAVDKLNGGNPATPVVTYTYGTTAGTVQNGQPTSIVDELSGVSQSITYFTSGPAKGLPASVSEDAGSGQTSTTEYTYNGNGERETSTITTPNGTTRYKYSHYGVVGFGTGEQRVFHRINRQVLDGSTWVNGPEEVRYIFDSLGRMARTDFAPTPQGSETNYDAYEPSSFASAKYFYDSVGRVKSVEHYKSVLVSGNYVETSVAATSAAYTHPLGLKTSTSHYTAGSGTNFNLQRTEVYGYDEDFDYLTEVDYNDGLANEVQTWSYDAAGNRTSHSSNPGSWTYDNLNMIETSPGTDYAHDLVGNRIRKTVGSAVTGYRWDLVNRMTFLGGLTAGTSHYGHAYRYRADGMRVRKEEGVTWVSSSGVESRALSGVKDHRTYYDGQMPVEEDEKWITGSVDKLTRNFVGVRGLEAITTTASNNTTTVYPLYDTHGNLVATLSKSGTSFTLGDQRTYDVWGGVRSGASTGGPKGRYVANLGHVQDDESGLIYMRARYYEPSTGRFVSEDQKKEGSNWFVYASNNPNAFVDVTGNSIELAAFGFAVGAFLIYLFSYAAGEGSIAYKGAQFVNAVIAGTLTYVFNSKAALGWAQKAGVDFANMMNVRFGNGEPFDKKAWSRPLSTASMLTNAVVIGYYVGYSMFLFFVMAELDEFAQRF